jgi:hypothetical protein
MSSQAVRLLMLASLCTAATVAAAPGANAGSRFDGRWSAVLRTQSGPCQPAYRGAVLHGLELRRRIGAPVRQFRRRNLARAHGKR